jgi:hypothetical protein
MTIVDPGSFWKVDFARDGAKTEFSHGLGHFQSLGKGSLLAPKLGDLHQGRVNQTVGA